jgi:hypothetical protein
MEKSQAVMTKLAASGNKTIFLPETFVLAIEDYDSENPRQITHPHIG